MFSLSNTTNISKVTWGKIIFIPNCLKHCLITFKLNKHTHFKIKLINYHLQADSQICTQWFWPKSSESQFYSHLVVCKASPLTGSNLMLAFLNHCRSYSPVLEYGQGMSEAPEGLYKTGYLLPPGQNSCHFADNIFRCIFVNEKLCILITFFKNLLLRVQLTIIQHWFR